MEYGMVTCRMPLSKKRAGNEILEREGLTPSSLIATLYDYLIQNNEAPKFFTQKKIEYRDGDIKTAKTFLDSVYHSKNEYSRYSDSEIREARIREMLSV